MDTKISQLFLQGGKLWLVKHYFHIGYN